MCSRLHGNKTSRYLLKYLFHRFRCRRHFLFQKDFARFIENAVVRPAIAEVHTNRELVSFENHVSIYPNSASLFHSRSPFHCALSTSNIGSVSHPAGDRPSHPICCINFLQKRREGGHLQFSIPYYLFPITYPLSFHILAHSFPLAKNSTLLFSGASALFAKNHPGRGTTLLPRAPRFAERGPRSFNLSFTSKL